MLLALLCLPAMTMAQPPFNNIYTYQTPYQNSVHTNAVQLINGNVAQGGTIDVPFTPAGQKGVEIGLINPAGGLILPLNLFYFDPDGIDLEAVDLVESPCSPPWVVQVADYRNVAGGLNRIEVFHTNPANGAIAWVTRLGNGLNFDLFGSAIITDNAGDLYVLGYIRNAAGSPDIYLAKIKCNGGVIWEFIYRDFDPNVGHQSIDLMYDQVSNSIVIASNRYRGYPNRDGIMTLEVNAAAGFVVAASHLPVLAGTQDFEVRDASVMFNNDLAIVGRINTAPTQGFLIRYMPPMLMPAAPFSIVYPDPNGIFMTGVKPFAGGAGGMFVSYEWGNAAGFTLPGMAELNPIGTPVPGQSYVYNVPAAYNGTRGLVALNGNVDFAVKGEVNFGINSLHMLADFTPLAFNPNPPVCNDRLRLRYYDSDHPVDIPIFEGQLFTAQDVDIAFEAIFGDIYDCFGNPIGAFRKAATGIAENAENNGINIYPNPTSGIVTIEISEEMADQYVAAEIFNVLGEMVINFNVNQPTLRVDLAGQTPGIYLLRMKGNDGQVSEPMRIMIR